ncbi:hypothetical protein [Rufibacter roseus]|uniref:Adhesin domain-containing protein n=1 Tax=Rufibacter roseus TaxID=1567108 RepID=A0ABW2DHX2_9BACT|nr:hypothetical protein [Rufibacter roseus]
MKNLLMAALLLWGSLAAYAQKKVVEKTLPVPATNKVKLNFKFGDNIKVTAWDKKEAYVKVTYEINGGTLNEALQLTFTPGKDQLQVLADLNEDLLKNSNFTGDCPEGYSMTFSTYVKEKIEKGSCTRIDYEVFLPRNTDLTLETINGDIELRGFTGPINAKSISGFVDMDWFQQKGATVALKTITGEVFSDVNIEFTGKRETMPIVGYQLKGNVNKGGPAIKLETISNNIYFRQK